MNDIFERVNHDNVVIILHGPAGCGKSTAIRHLSLDLAANLVDYNPLYGDLAQICLLCQNQESPITVISFEEFDIALSHIVNQSVPNANDLSCDIRDKASWNGKIDAFKRSIGCVLVLTTNKTYEELPELVKGDLSYIRFGRVDAHIVWDSDNKICVKKPYDVSLSYQQPIQTDKKYTQQQKRWKR
jgi:hypothetical protein